MSDEHDKQPKTSPRRVSPVPPRQAATPTATYKAGVRQALLAKLARAQDGSQGQPGNDRSSPDPPLGPTTHRTERDLLTRVDVPRRSIHAAGNDVATGALTFRADVPPKPSPPAGGHRRRNQGLETRRVVVNQRCRTRLGSGAPILLGVLALAWVMHELYQRLDGWQPSRACDVPTGTHATHPNGDGTIAGQAGSEPRE